MNENEKVDLSLDNKEFYTYYGRKKTVGMFTLGCKVNQYETDAMAGIFNQAGYEVVDFEDIADVYVINTCTVTNLSDKKSRQMIRRAKGNNENAVIVVAGCYAQTAPDEVSSIEGVNLVIGTKERSKIIEYIEELEEGRDRLNVVGDIMSSRDFEELVIDNCSDRTRAYLKIQEGCSQFCSYCIIPYARGPIRSRDPESVVKEVKRLAENGFKEIVLTGIHIASYGKDIRNTSLIDIIRRIHDTRGIERLRLGSLEPTVINEEFISMAKALNKLCPHYHLSLQSGCDETLKRMNRKYTLEDYRNVVKLLRDNIKDVAVTTDIMVGFPGETELEFQKTCEFVNEIGFSKMHVFKYSPRKGTPAAKLSSQIPPKIKEERSKILLEIDAKKILEFNRSFEGTIQPVLFEQEVKQREGFFEGLTPSYIRVECNGNYNFKGNIFNVLLEKAEKDYILGHIKE